MFGGILMSCRWVAKVAAQQTGHCSNVRLRAASQPVESSNQRLGLSDQLWLVLWLQSIVWNTVNGHATVEGCLDGMKAGWVVQSVLLKHFVDVTGL